MALFSKIYIILYVENQEKSKDFYSKLLRSQPVLDVPGMTEFQLTETCKLGLMPNSGIQKILQDKRPDPASGNGIPRCELYLYAEDLAAEFENALNCGAQLIRSIENRDWGDQVCYLADADGHIIAFAKPINS